MHILKRLLLLLLIPALILCLFGCEEEPDPQGAQTTPQGGAESTEEDPYQADHLPDDLDFDGETFRVYTWTEAKEYDWNTTPSSEVISHSIYTGRRFVAERLNIVFDVVDQSGNWDARATFVNNLATYLMAGYEIDMVDQYTAAAALGAMKGIYANLNEVPHVDFSQPWWPGNIQDSCAIGNNVYFCSGDITMTMIHTMGSLFVNLDLWSSYGIQDDLYQVVRDREWTMEKLMEVSLDKVPDGSDSYGIFVCWRSAYDNLFYGAGMTFTARDSENQLIVSPDIASQKMDDYYQICRNLLHDNPDVESGNIATDRTIENTFMNNKALIYMSTQLSDARNYLKDVLFDFAVVPYPMYDSHQKDYHSLSGYGISMFSIPKDARNMEMSGAVLEALGSAGYRYITPKVYEESFRHRFLQSPDNAEMLDIIHDTMVYDAGRFFADDIAMFNLFRRSHENVEWTSHMQMNYEVWEANVRRVSTKLG